MVLSGMLIRELEIAGTSTRELLGPSELASARLGLDEQVVMSRLSWEGGTRESWVAVVDTRRLLETEQGARSAGPAPWSPCP